eukprot:41022_1
MDRFLVPKSKYRLTPTYNVFSISHNLKHGPRKQTFQSKVQYKYKARIDLLKKNTDPTRFRDGYPKDKAGAIDLIRRVHGQQNTDRYQANITAYMLHYQAQQTAQREVFNHKNLVTMILTQLVEEQGETARSIFHLRLINKAWNEAMKTQRLRREYMSIACYFNVSKDDAEEYVCCFSDKEEELYHRVIGQTICDRSWMLLSVNDMLLFCKSMFQERMSKNDIRQKMMDYYHVTYNTVKNDYRCRLALKIFKSRIESDDYY